MKKPAYQLVVANALWGQKGYAFKPDFTKLLEKSYGAGLNDVDFAQSKEAAKTINDWVAKQTKDKIKDLIPEAAITDLTRLVLTNAVYFKSNWDNKFTKAATKDAPFKLSTDKSLDVPMMHQRSHFGYVENDDLQVLELPYTQNELSMLVVLPRKDNGLADVEKTLTADIIEKWLKDKKHELVDVTMPKFTFSSEFGLAGTLKAMGMTDAFDAGKADFSGMTDKEKLCISAVIHKAFVAVDEDGTEAAAATAVMMTGSAMRVEQPKTFLADHPFVFIIRHNATGEILFMGRLANPKAD
jgi:serpin B